MPFFTVLHSKAKKMLFSTIHIGAKPVLKGTCDSALERGNCVLSVCHEHISLKWKFLTTKKSGKFFVFFAIGSFASRSCNQRAQTSQNNDQLITSPLVLDRRPVPIVEGRRHLTYLPMPWGPLCTLTRSVLCSCCPVVCALGDAHERLKVA